jgi:hypothetical protein
MRKRSKYRPKERLLNPLGYVVENSKGLAEQHSSYVTELKIKNHAAMLALTRGEAVTKDMDCLIQMCNIMDAFRILGVGGVEDEITAVSEAIYAICVRVPKTGKFIATGAEITALNTLMGYHDELIEHITVKQLDDAIKIVRYTIRANKAKKLPEVQL